ncbi:MAG: SNF2-related protein, partial [Raoultibacter sp.]
GAEKLKRLNADTNLIVCQKSKIQDWIDHFKTHYPTMTIRDLTKPLEFDDFLSRFIAWHNCYGAGTWIGVINYELVFRKRCERLKQLHGFTLLLDESSLIQNDTAKRTKFILDLTPENVILLSGTPTSGRYENLWSQAHLLGWDISKKLFNQHYVNWQKIEIEGVPIWVVDKDDPYKNVERLKDKFREHGAFFKKTEECFDLPEQNFITVPVKTIPEYKKFLKRGVVKFDDVYLGNIELVGDSPLKSLLYARMLCGQYNPNKFQALQDLIQSSNERFVIFYNFNEELRRLKALMQSMGRVTSEINGATKDLYAYEMIPDSVTLVQYQAGAMGLNLQRANRIIYFSLTDKSELFEQSKKRIHRIGQERPCYYYLLICAGSVEERMLDALERRRDYTDELFREDVKDV